MAHALSLSLVQGKHTIILVQYSRNLKTRTFFDYETVAGAMDGVCQLYEQQLKELNPDKPNITYDISLLYQYIDSLFDLSALVYVVLARLPACLCVCSLDSSQPTALLLLDFPIPKLRSSHLDLLAAQQGVDQGARVGASQEGCRHTIDDDVAVLRKQASKPAHRPSPLPPPE